MRGWVACGLATIALTTSAAVGAAVGTAAAKPVIRSASEVPPSRFKLAGPPSTAFLGDAFLTETVPALRAEAERIRASFEIADTALADRLRAGLAAIALLQRRPQDAAALVAESRDAATKPQQRAIGMLVQDALTASAEVKAGNGCSAGAARIAKLLAASDPAIVRDDALQRLTQTEVVAQRFLSGTIEAEMDKGVAARGGTNLVEGLKLASFRATATLLPPCRTDYAAAIRRWIALPSRSRPTSGRHARRRPTPSPVPDP